MRCVVEVGPCGRFANGGCRGGCVRVVDEYYALIESVLCKAMSEYYYLDVSLLVYIISVCLSVVL
jgi:hypothetical protein